LLPSVHCQLTSLWADQVDRGGQAAAGTDLWELSRVPNQDRLGPSNGRCLQHCDQIVDGGHACFVQHDDCSLIH
jgi:hypothetical protein